MLELLVPRVLLRQRNVELEYAHPELIVPRLLVLRAQVGLKLRLKPLPGDWLTC